MRAMNAGSRVDVVDPSGEGQSIIRALRAEGLAVNETSIDDLTPANAARVVLVAAELDRAASLLAELHASAAGTTALLLGLPLAGQTADFPDLREDAVFPRPVAVSRLVRRVATLLAPEERRLTVPEEDEPAQEVPLERPVEQTMQLSAATLAGALAPSAAGDARPTAPGNVEGPAVELSSQLVTMLRSADRRLFPNLPELDLRVTAGDETARELVPNDLLEAVATPVDTLEEDETPDAFTFFGPPPDAVLAAGPGITPSPSDSRSGSQATGSRANESPRTVPEARVPRSAPAALSGSVTIDYFDLGEPLPEGEGRRGELSGGAALGVCFRLWERRLTVLLTLEPAGSPAIALGLRDGRPAFVEGAIHTHVAHELGLMVDSSVDETLEESARRTLERSVKAGLLPSYDLDRRVSTTRRRLLIEALTEQAGSFRIETPKLTQGFPDPDRVALIRGSLPSLLLEAARRRLRVSELHTITGEGDAKLELLGGAHRIFRASEVEPELVRLLERNDGVDPRAMATSLPSTLGIPGLLIALSQMGAVRLSRGEARSSNDTPLSGAAILRAQARALDGNYFEILGVPLDVRSSELEAAHARRLAELGAPHALLEQDPRLASALRDALAGLEEARRVLSVESLRARYREALSP